MEQLFILFSLLIIFSTIMVITSINPIQSVFWLVLVFLISGCILITLNINYIALLLIIIYVGAIAILFLFVIMMLDMIQLKSINTINNVIPIVFIFFSCLMFNIFFNLNKNIFSFIKNFTFEENFHIFTLLQWLYNDQSYFIIIISLILFIAMIGAIILTLELSPITKKQSLSYQHQRNNSWI